MSETKTNPTIQADDKTWTILFPDFRVAPNVLTEIVADDKTWTILFPDLLRPLHPDERQALMDSIREHGITAPVVVDENDGIIDGANRVSIAAELGLTYIPFTRIPRDLTDDQKLERALSLNVARRQLSEHD